MEKNTNNLCVIFLKFNYKEKKTTIIIKNFIIMAEQE